MVPSTLRYVLVAHMRLTCRRRLHHRGQPTLTLAPVGADAGIGAPEAPMVRRHPRNSFSVPLRPTCRGHARTPRARTSGRESRRAARAAARRGRLAERREGGARAGKAEGGRAARAELSWILGWLTACLPRTPVHICGHESIPPPCCISAGRRLHVELCGVGARRARSVEVDTLGIAARRGCPVVMSFDLDHLVNQGTSHPSQNSLRTREGK